MFDSSGKSYDFDPQTIFDLLKNQGKKDYMLDHREKLVKNLQKKYKKGVLLVWSGFEVEGQLFKPDAIFYYLTHISEPGMVVALDVPSGKTTLFIPQLEVDRSKWVKTKSLHPTKESVGSVFIDEILYLGQKQEGYIPFATAPIDVYKNLIAFIEKIIKSKKNIFIYTPDVFSGNIIQTYMQERLKKNIPELSGMTIDVSKELAALRQNKNPIELENIYEAIRITGQSLHMIFQMLLDGEIEREREIQSVLHSYITMQGAELAFPSIVASGKNATILHYVESNGFLDKKNLLLIDCGARYNYYCSDITRTVPLSGVFSKRQKELYQLVLDTQQYIAEIARPGYWLNNKEYPEKSLQHLAVAFLKERGYEKYFIHGIGHHLGLDVHDFSDATLPLSEGDVFTIEPGLYIKDEEVGIRIEDDYVMTKNGTDCLSSMIPKEIDDVEQWMQQEIDFDAFEQTQYYDK